MDGRFTDGTGNCPVQYYGNYDRLAGKHCPSRPSGDVINSVIGAGVTIAKGAVVKDSIVMQGSVIGASTSVEKAIIAENVKVGSDVQIGVGEYAPSTYDQKVYQFDLATIGENSIIPDGVKIGKNTAIAGETTVGDYPDGLLASGNYIIKAGGVK